MYHSQATSGKFKSTVIASTKPAGTLTNLSVGLLQLVDASLVKIRLG